MVMPTARPIAVLVKRGGGLVIPLTEVWVKRLGWNKDDTLALAVVEGSLVITKVILPRPPDFRNHKGQGESTHVPDRKNNPVG